MLPRIGQEWIKNCRCTEFPFWLKLGVFESLHQYLPCRNLLEFFSHILLCFDVQITWWKSHRLRMFYEKCYRMFMVVTLKGRKRNPPRNFFQQLGNILEVLHKKCCSVSNLVGQILNASCPEDFVSAHVQMQNFKRKSEFFSAKNIIVTVFKVLNILRKLWKVSSFYKMKLIGDVNFQIYRRYQKKLFLVIKCTFQFLTICVSRVLRRWRVSHSR